MVERCHPQDPTWLRARAMLRAFGLDPRRFDDDATTEPGMQLLSRPLGKSSADWGAALVPADHYIADLSFPLSVLAGVSFPLDDEEQRQEFCSAIAEVVGSPRFRAARRAMRFDRLRLALEYVFDYEQAAKRMAKSSFTSRDVYEQQNLEKAQAWKARAQALEAQLAHPGDLPATPEECLRLADNGFTEFLVGLSGPMRFERAVKEFVVREEEALKAELSQAWPQSERARGG